MGIETGISWTDHTFNPWRGCTKVSEACRYCYAETWAKRTGKKIWGPDAPRELAAEAYWRQPVKWNADAAAAKVRRRVFCSSLADVFEDRPELVAPRARLFDLIQATPALDWLLLTKRPENAVDIMGGASGTGLRAEPLPNLWMGTTAETQADADKRIPALLEIPAAVHFVSAEPLLEPLDLTRYFEGNCSSCGRGVPKRGPGAGECSRCEWGTFGDGLDWVIVGGESGGQARPMHPDWARSLRDQSVRAGVAFHFKQWGEWHPTMRNAESRVANAKNSSWHNWPDIGYESHVSLRVGKAKAGRVLDRRTWDEFPEVSACLK